MSSQGQLLRCYGDMIRPVAMSTHCYLVGGVHSQYSFYWYHVLLYMA